MGDKLQAKALARAAKVSLVPGHESEVKNNDEVMAAGPYSAITIFFFGREYFLCILLTAVSS